MKTVFINTFANGGYFDSTTGSYKLPIEHEFEFSPSLTDQSYFIPSKHELSGSQLSNSKIDSAAYDFPDGKITEHLFDSMVDIRNPSLDIVEKKDLLEKTYSSVSDMVKKDLNTAYQDKLNKKLKDSKVDSLVSQSVSNNSANNSANNSTNNSAK